MTPPIAPPPPPGVVVTGGASGIGLAMSRHFASQGYKVAILDVDATNGTNVVATLASEYPAAKVIFKKCDVSSWDEQASVFKAVFDQFQQINVVMANAGISESGVSSLARFGDVDMEPSRPVTKALDVNLTGVIYTVHLASHYMVKTKATATHVFEDRQFRASIVCTSSNAGLYPLSVAPLYAASKAGVIGLVRSMAKPLAREGIQINALAPAVLAPSKELFKEMIITPMSTLIRGVQQFLDDPNVTGEVAEIHGDNVTIRKHHDYVDADTLKNIQMFESLGYA